ncbi:hemin uptake protein HemP [Methyloglobulus morosus KoM1]|uniref:Hemin uptake protein HemP n=1 Tax=Methyloglobulus morosus KoM1 TaxID=1116472 RepID=V5C3Q7_9GAMM|nr:hemin uptake protein HemP [Methyloglobulus morosus]ESS71453.1 hemin uptake protein HemP [Methyloglobulus morosus KoM1]
MINKIHIPIPPTDFELHTQQEAMPVSRPRIHSAELFGSAREVLIEHGGEEYRLRLTRQDKLILTK